MHYPFEVIKRPLTSQEAEILVQEVRKTPNITGYTVKEWLQCQHVFVAVGPDGQMLGACMNDDFAREWTEIAVLIVLEPFRQRGIGRGFIEASLRNLQQRRRNVLIISREPNVLRMMKEFRFDLYPSLLRVDGPYKKHKFTLGVYYPLRAMMSFYRWYEVRRKKSVFGNQASFTYGLKPVFSPVAVPLAATKTLTAR